MPQVAEVFTSDKAIAALEAGADRGVRRRYPGNPIFSTDTASALRALEIGADAMFKATMVDGVYDKDPHKYPDAVKYETLTFTRVLDERLAVMDSTAATLCATTGCPSWCSTWATRPTSPGRCRGSLWAPLSGNKTFRPADHGPEYDFTIRSNRHEQHNETPMKKR